MEQVSRELMTYLSQIANKSLVGGIPWNQPNPSTFMWLKSVDGDEIFQVTIQKATAPRIKPGLLAYALENHTYLFQVNDRKTKQTSISLSSAERPELQAVLESIYISAEKGMDIRSSQVLQKLLAE
jgi:hypothetical protein